MKASLIFLLLLLACCNPVPAQEKTPGLIKGHIFDSGNGPVDVANVLLLKAADSALVSSTISDATGFFQFSGVGEGTYLLDISHVSYGRKGVNVMLGKANAAIVLDTVRLEMKENLLQEVIATAAKPLFTKEKDRLVFNVENSIVSSLHTDVVELIRNLPGVWIDRQNNIVLNGQNKVSVTINDRPVYVTRNELIQMLRAIPVSNVTEVAIITSPNARSDADGAGIINIKTRTTVSSGLNGTVNSAAGSSIGYGRFYPRYSSGVNLSVGLKNFSFFANFNYDYKKTLGEINEKLSFETAVLNQLIRFENLPEKTRSLSAGANVELPKKQSIALFYTGSYTTTVVDQRNEINITDPPGLPANILSTAAENPGSTQGAFNFTYRKELDSLKSFRVISDYITLNKSNIAAYENTTTLDNDQVVENITNNSFTDIRVWAGQMDYTQTIKGNGKLEAGMKYSDVGTGNVVDFNSSVDRSPVSDSIQSNTFQYREKLYAFYLNYTTNINKLGISTGLRYENSEMSGTSSVSLFAFKRNYRGLFPSISLEFPLNRKIDVSLSYQRRIARPNYVDINPFVYYVNPYVVLEGNPSLVPSYTNKVQLNMSLGKIYSASLAYFRTTDVFTMAQFQDINSKRQRLMPTNIGDLSNLELNLEIPLNPKPWWESYFSIGLLHQMYTENQSVDLGFSANARTTFQLFSQHVFSLPAGIGLELDNTLITPSVQGQFTYKTIYSFSLGLKKMLMSNRLVLKAGVSDLLRTLRYDGTLEGIGWRSDFGNISDSRQFRFSLSYNFLNKGKVKARRAEWISGDEEKRMK